MIAENNTEVRELYVILLVVCSQNSRQQGTFSKDKTILRCSFMVTFDRNSYLVYKTKDVHGLNR